MPSAIIGNASGGDWVVSGVPWIRGGHPLSPWGSLPPANQLGAGIQLRWSPNSSGNLYVGLSGGLTVNSGGFLGSGYSGLLDGVLLGPGDAYFIPRVAASASGLISVFATCDVAASGLGRLYWEVY